MKLTDQEAAQLIADVAALDGRPLTGREVPLWMELLDGFTNEEMRHAFISVARQPRAERPARIEPRDLIAVARRERREWMRVHRRDWGAVRPWDGVEIQPTTVDLIEQGNQAQ